MDFELLIYGLIALLLGTISRITESKLSKKEKQEREMGYSQAAYIYGGWALLIFGTVAIIVAVIKEA